MSKALTGQSARIGISIPLPAGVFHVLTFSFVVNVLLFVSPLFMMQVYDRVLASRSGVTLLALLAIAAFLMALGSAVELVRSRILVRAGLAFDRETSSLAYDAAHGRLRADQGGSAAPQLLRDVDSVREFLGGSGVVAFCDAPWTPLFVAMCWLMHPWLGATALVGAFLVFGLAVLNEWMTRKTTLEASKASSDALGEATTAFRNSDAVRAMGMQSDLRAIWQERRGEAVSRQTRVNDVSGAILTASKFVRMGLQTAILAVGAWLAVVQEVSPGAMMAASILMGRALAPVELAVANWKGFLTVRESLKRLSSALATHASQPVRIQLPDPTGKLDVEGLVVVPTGSPKPTLRDVSFTVAPGEALGVVGQSAAGKTTMLRCLVGARAPSAGSVRIDGHSLEQWDAEQIGSSIGYLPQDIELFSGSVARNIARMGEVDMEAVIEAATAAGLHDAIQHFPQGYETKVGQGGFALSGGMRQRVALARALFRLPKLLVLDEPNSNLDGPGEEALLRAILSAKAWGATVVVSTHKPSLLRVADQVMVLSEGRVADLGPRDRILPMLAGGRPPQPAAAPQTATAA